VESAENYRFTAVGDLVRHRSRRVTSQTRGDGHRRRHFVAEGQISKTAGGGGHMQLTNGCDTNSAEIKRIFVDGVDFTGVAMQTNLVRPSQAKDLDELLKGFIRTCRLHPTEYFAVMNVLHKNFVRTVEALQLNQNRLHEILHPVLADAVIEQLKGWSAAIPPAQTNGNNIPPAQTNSNNIPPVQTNSNNIPPAQTNSNNVPPAQTNSNNVPPVQTNTEASDCVAVTNVGAKRERWKKGQRSVARGRENKEWVVENLCNAEHVKLEDLNIRQNVCIRDCGEDCIVEICKKVNNVLIDRCQKTNVILESLLGSVEVVNCDKVKIQILQRCSNLTLDSCNAVTMYLGVESKDVIITTAKCSEVLVVFPNVDAETGEMDMLELPIPEQFQTVIEVRCVF